jgi:hypothetical protein
VGWILDGGANQLVNQWKRDEGRTMAVGIALGAFGIELMNGLYFSIYK